MKRLSHRQKLIQRFVRALECLRAPCAPRVRGPICIAPPVSMGQFIPYNVISLSDRIDVRVNARSA